MSDLPTTARTCSMLLHRRAVDRQQHVAGLHAGQRGRRRWRPRPAGRCRRRPRAAPRGCSGRSARPSLPLLARLRRCSATCAALSLASAQLRASSCLGLALAPDFQLAPCRPGAARPITAGRSPDETIGWPSTLRITSPGCRPALSAGPPFSTLDTSAPSGLSSLKESAKRLVHLLHRHAQARMLDLAGGDDLVLDLASPRRSGSRTTRPGSRRCGCRSAS